VHLKSAPIEKNCAENSALACSMALRFSYVIFVRMMKVTMCIPTDLRSIFLQKLAKCLSSTPFSLLALALVPSEGIF